MNPITYLITLVSVMIDSRKIRKEFKELMKDPATLEGYKKVRLDLAAKVKEPNIVCGITFNPVTKQTCIDLAGLELVEGGLNMNFYNSHGRVTNTYFIPNVKKIDSWMTKNLVEQSIVVGTAGLGNYILNVNFNF